MEGDEPPSPSYIHCRGVFFVLKDISNFKTPKRLHNPNFHSPCPQHFFTASKQTPKSYASFMYRRGLSKSNAKTVAARRLKSLELEQTKSAYKSKLKKEQSLKSLSKSLTVWLNFLIQSPKLCGCDRIGTYLVVTKGKREGGDVMTWRSPKRHRDMWWKGENDNVDVDVDLAESKSFMLKNSLKDVCSFDDLKQRMSVYLSVGGCKEVFRVMTLVIKNIDDGRLNMKSHCPIVTDFGMKEKATRVLMSYNPIWLRIGLYIIFGGDSLLSNEDVNSEQETAFLKMIIEKQFFSHAGLAKAYAYNKKVEGLYRPGYYETLGTVILKRFLLLVLILDRAKFQGILPLKYGIDGIDGGSPLLFLVKSSIKSSRQVIVDFLSLDVMHGEGNLLAHLVIVGYKVSYQQSPLVEYDFRVRDLFVDLQDGLRLGRIIQLLLQDASILTKLVVPSDTRKKNLTNCGIALQYLRKAGVMLYDEDRTAIMEDDVADGDKELILSLLWNMFVHLQLPLLINKKVLEEEICKLQGTSVDQLNSIGSTLDMLLNWIQVVCQKYDYQIDNFSSLVDGKAIWCLLDFYFRKAISCSCSSKDHHETRGEESIMSATDYTDAFHNLILSQKLTTLLGSFPEVLQMSEILEHNGACSDRSVVILLVFLSSQLIVKKNMDQLNFHKLLDCNCQILERRRSNIECWTVNSVASSDLHDEKDDSNEDAVRKFKALQAWWREMAEKNYKSASKPLISTWQSFSTSNDNINLEKGTRVGQAVEGIVKQSEAEAKIRGNAAQVIQSHFRRWIQRRSFLKMRTAVSFLQIAIRVSLEVKFNSTLQDFDTENVKHSEIVRYVKFIVEKHGFGRLKKSVLFIQRATRTWISHKRLVESMHNQAVSSPYLVSGAMDVQTCVPSILEIEKTPLMYQEKGDRKLETEAALKIQLAWRNFTSNKSLHKKCVAATKVQSHFRGWQLRQRFLVQKQATIKIQSHFRCITCQRAFQQNKVVIRSAIVIQSCIRGWIARRRASRLWYLIVIIQVSFADWF
ncbi:abnormal spindle-like microcephaly-associated protein homolog [Pistacia vera]|uniref:abnormal spindle-like microcephaly-associated protein homolog n=1 Tax=Pistacia vera TaxID=55513 RepID=UPI0012638322|nr:abnormal spindle-like microcephaly-associated protein homolog [Pistacia vera]